jgi:N-acetylmuramoyl-L-alanine amidase
MRPRPGLRGIQTILVNDRLLKQIRMAETQRGVTRVVLDLAAPVDFTVSQLTNPDRLIIELRAAKAAAPPPAAIPKLPLPEPITPVATASVPKPPAAEPKASPTAPAETKATVPTAAATESRAPAAGAAAAQRDSRGDRSLIRALGLKVGRVVLDPGHGGHDTGSISPGGLVEKDLVLDIAKRVGALIAERLDSEVVYTRTDDTFVPLEARTGLANEHKADLFVSLHANSSRLRGIAGPETYYLNFTTSASALEVAARENATSEKTIHELQELVQKITLKTKVQESREFAAALQKSLYGNLFKGKAAAKDRGVKRAPFVVLIGASMPSVLVELDFLTNPRSEKLLKNSEHRQRVAEALFKGVAQYASSLSHFQVAQTGQTKTGP